MGSNCFAILYSFLNHILCFYLYFEKKGRKRTHMYVCLRMLHVQVRVFLFQSLHQSFEQLHFKMVACVQSFIDLTSRVEGLIYLDWLLELAVAAHEYRMVIFEYVKHESSHEFQIIQLYVTSAIRFQHIIHKINIAPEPNTDTKLCTNTRQWTHCFWRWTTGLRFWIVYNNFTCTIWKHLLQFKLLLYNIFTIKWHIVVSVLLQLNWHVILVYGMRNLGI